MGQVLKFKYGGASRSKQNLELEENIKAIQNALGTNPERADELNALAESFANYQKANNLSNRDARHFQLEASRVMRGVAEGNPLPAGANPILVGKTVFDSDNETKGRVDEVIRAHRKANESAYNKPSQAATTTQSNGFQLLHTYNGDFGLNDATNYLDTDLTARIGLFSKILGDNITNALNANSKGYRVSTPNGISIENLQSALSELQALNAGLGTNKATAKEYNTLVDIARKAGVNGAVFANFFKDFLPKETTASKNKKSLLQEGFADYDFGTSGLHQSLIDWAKKNKYNFLTKDGETYIFDKDFNRISPISYVNMDYRNAGYNQGLFSDAEGKIWAGDVNNLTSEDWAKDLYTNYANLAKTKRTKGFTKGLVFDPYKDVAKEGSEVLDKLAELNGNKKFNYVDVSRLFGGDKLVVALSPTGQFSEDQYGNILLNNGIKLYYLDDEGNLVEKTIDNTDLTFNLEGFDNEATRQVFNHDILADFEGSLVTDTENYDPEKKDLMGRTFLDSLKWFGTAGALTGAGIGISGGPLTSGLAALAGGAVGALAGAIRHGSFDNVAEDPLFFINAVVKAMKDPNGDLAFATNDIDHYSTNREVLRKLGFNKDPLNFLAMLNLVIDQYDVKISPEDKKYLAQRYNYWLTKAAQQAKALKRMESSNEITSEKEGGILKAEKGSRLDIFGLPIEEDNWLNQAKQQKINANKGGQDEVKEEKLRQEAQAKGYGRNEKSVERYVANNEKLGENWSAADTLRLFTLASDVGSIVSSFTPSAGTTAALGVASLGFDTVADLADPSVSGVDVAKNLAINTGLALVGMIPGAKIPKVMTKLVKFAPKMIYAASTMGIALDESTKKTFSKLNSPDAQLTREDWKNIVHLTSLVAAGIRGGRLWHADNKNAKVGNITGEIKNQKIGLKNKDNKDIEVPEETLKSINKAISDKDNAAIKTYREQLKAQGATEESLNEVFKIKKSLKDKAKDLVGKGKAPENPEYETIKGEAVKPKNVDEIIAKLNEEQLKLDAFANKNSWNRFWVNAGNWAGGGARTYVLSAIIRNNPELGLGIQSQYYGKYNPLIDWSRKRHYLTGLKWEALNGKPNSVINPINTTSENNSTNNTIVPPTTTAETSIWYKLGGKLK